MGEIKSTLDLVMEKTKHLSLSSEEKERQRHDEIRQRLKGLLQKFQDQILNRNQFTSEYHHLRKEYNLAGHKVLTEEILDKLEPDRIDQALLGLLEDFCGTDISAITSALEDYQAAIRTASEERARRLKEELAQQYFISGSAVVPNLAADDVWQDQVRHIRSGFEHKLGQEKAKLEGS